VYIYVIALLRDVLCQLKCCQMLHKSMNKQVSYRRGTARRLKSVEILSDAA